MNKKSEFLQAIQDHQRKDQLVRITLSKPQDSTSTLKKVLIKVATIKKKLKFSVVYRHATNDITKNYELPEGFQLLDQLIGESFLIATLFTTEQDYTLQVHNNSFSLSKKSPTFSDIPNKTHDKQKKKLIYQNDYLVELGILDASGRVKKDKGDKYKQIKKFVEIIESLIQKTPRIHGKSELTIFDMGAGKGYLTFALYEYLTHRAKINAKITGVEIRPDLIDLCNNIAAKVKFENLSFEAGFIQQYDLPPLDILIALHACDTATDDAIFKGIQAGSELIICAPCCHKQIRKQFKVAPPLDSISHFGILKERQAEIVTDTIRALLLEASGYKAKVFEFISSEHTGKNLMIVGQKHSEKFDETIFLNKIKSLKQSFGIERHYLEDLLGNGLKSIN